MHSTTLTTTKRLSPRSIISFIIILLLFGGGMWFWHYLHNPNRFPIRTVKVSGEYQHASNQKIEKIVSPLVKKSLFSVNLTAIRKELMQLPWVKSVVVERMWPDELMIKLSEKIPLAVWNTKGLLSSRGKLFYPERATFPQTLPQFVGPKGKQAQMLSTYRQITRLISSLDLHIVQLVLSSDMLWRMKLSNGMDVMVGEQAVLPRIKRFVRVYNTVFADKRRAKYIDLRYADGLAVKWDDTTRDAHG